MVDEHGSRRTIQVINRDLGSVITREREGYYIQQRQLDSMQCQIRETQQTLTELEINVQGLHSRLTHVECHLQEVLRTARCLLSMKCQIPRLPTPNLLRFTIRTSPGERKMIGFTDVQF